jgi:hypothetical protein
MPIVGFGFNKISIERTAPIKGKINVNTNAGFTGVETFELNLGLIKGKAAKFNFEFSSKYEPKIAEIKMSGEVTYFDKPEKIDEIGNSWKKDKKIPREIMTLVMNDILSKCSFEALLLEREMGLPPSLQLPKIVAKEPEKGK